jgi:hypothetical protein
MVRFAEEFVVVTSYSQSQNKKDCIITCLIVGLGKENKVIPFNKPSMRIFDTKTWILPAREERNQSPG